VYNAISVSSHTLVHCTLWLRHLFTYVTLDTDFDKIEHIGHNDADFEWSAEMRILTDEAYFLNSFLNFLELCNSDLDTFIDFIAVVN